MIKPRETDFVLWGFSKLVRVAEADVGGDVGAEREREEGTTPIGRRGFDGSRLCLFARRAARVEISDVMLMLLY